MSGLLADERARRGTRTGQRALSCFAHAVLALRWFLDAPRASAACGVPSRIRLPGLPITNTVAYQDPSCGRHWRR